MADYISREAAITAVKVHCPAKYEAAVLARIVCVPAADVAEVVRCKDCEHNYGTQKAPRCDFTEFRLTPNSYCSCGFRKMDEEGEKNEL